MCGTYHGHFTLWMTHKSCPPIHVTRNPQLRCSNLLATSLRDLQWTGPQQFQVLTGVYSISWEFCAWYIYILCYGSGIDDSIHILQGCSIGTGAIIWLPQCQWSNPAEYVSVIHTWIHHYVMGLVPPGNRPLPSPMLTKHYDTTWHQHEPMNELASVLFVLTHSWFVSERVDWNFR